MCRSSYAETPLHRSLKSDWPGSAPIGELPMALTTLPDNGVLNHQQHKHQDQANENSKDDEQQ
ncbi:hypothetical protein PSCICM_14840 [Pseudomonas cichorii]|nr:hypothetical protein PSCICM_14840 [Pseudomonas cichorii]